MNLFIKPVAATTQAASSTIETTDAVKAGGKYVTLLGQPVFVGDTAPNFTVVNDSFSPVTLAQFKGKNILISVVPSLDTGVCSIQTKRFNDEASKLSDSVIMLTISNDLPFAQKRFCKSENIENIRVLSDSVWRDFGNKYGLLIKDMGLLTRAIFIIDSAGVIHYKELVANISEHPDYDNALAALTSLITVEKNTPAIENDIAKEKNTSKKASE